MKKIAFLCLIAIFMSANTALSQVSIGENGRISTTVFADYYWIAQSHNEEIEDNNGFWFRRINFTYDHKISDSFSGRFRLEMESEGDFTTRSELPATVRDAYIRWSNDNHSITAGISPTPTWGLVDDMWGYRSVEKSPLDLYDFGGSRDFGLTFEGDLDSDGRLQYNFMFANGSGTRNELNKGKKFMFALSYYVTENVVIQGYGDWEDNTGNTDVYTAQGFAGYESDSFNFGALYAYQFRENTEEAGDRNLDLASVFANTRVAQNVKVFGRVDHFFDRYLDGPGNDYIPFSDQAESTFITAGVDMTLENNIHLIPNVEAIVYKENEAGFKPESDLIPRLTLFYKF